MSSSPFKSFQSPASGADLLSRAASLLAAEVTRLQPIGAPAARPGSEHGVPALDPSAVLRGGPAAGMRTPRAIQWSPISALTEAVPNLPEVGAIESAPDLISSALASTHGDELRRRMSELLEALLTALAQGKTASASPYDDRVPLIRGLAPAQAGSTASASIRITNEEIAASVVSFYASNFVSDSGYEMPSLLVAISPRKATLPPGGEATFEIKIAVPAQAPPGSYSGLVQATGCRYVKAVVTFEVL